MFGKIIGTILGSLVANLPGAVIGFIIGMYFDHARKNHQGFGNFGDQAQIQSEFFDAAFAVMGHVAKANGRVTKEEIQLASIMMDKMKLSPEQKRMAQQAFNRGKEENFPLVDTLNRMRNLIGRRRDLLQFFFELQISAAFADGSVDQSELKVLQTIARGLGYSEQYLQQRLRMQEAAYRFQQGGGFGGFGGQSYGSGQGSQGQYQQRSTASQLKDAYEVLGVAQSADGKAIKRAYRKLMNEHHPDKLSAKGLPPQMMEVAKQKAQEIQAAYDLIKKEKGFK